jgi:hypothetical protein
MTLHTCAERRHDEELLSSESLSMQWHGVNESRDPAERRSAGRRENISAVI